MDALPLHILDGYRYRANGQKKSTILQEIKKKTAEESEETNQPKTKRLKRVYLVNRTKYWIEANSEELLKDLDMDSPTEDTHRILQHKIR